MTSLKDAEARVLGLTCVVERWDFSWSFAFEDVCALTISCPWRMLRGGVVLADADDRQQYGLPEPVDGESRANELLRSARVNRFQLIEPSADLKVGFDNGIQLETFTNSIGYESWQANFGGEVFKAIIGMGGGGLAIF